MSACMPGPYCANRCDFTHMSSPAEIAGTIYVRNTTHA